MDGESPMDQDVGADGETFEDGQLEDEEEGEVVREKIGSDISDEELDFGDADGPASPAAVDTSQEVYSTDGEIEDEPQPPEPININGMECEPISPEASDLGSAPASPEPAPEEPAVYSPSQREACEGEEDSARVAGSPVRPDNPERPLAPGDTEAPVSISENKANNNEDGELSDDEPENQTDAYSTEQLDKPDSKTRTDSSKSSKRDERKDSKSNSDKVDLKINVGNATDGDNKRTVFTIQGQDGNETQIRDLRETINGAATDKLNSSFNRASIHDDHGELDYDEELGDEDVQKRPSKPDATADQEEREEGETVDDPNEKEDDMSSNLSSSEGEVNDDDDCEEGEIKEPGDHSPRPFVKPMCRFYTRGHCTWGDNCRFLHPGINDKGNYSLIERTGPPSVVGPARNNAGPWNDMGGTPEEILPPPPEEPVTESAWERGLRQAKELRKLASKRKQTDADFEEKRMTLKMEVQEDREFNKENDRRVYPKDPYYDNAYEDEDDFYTSSKPTDHWQQGRYENFEVRWTREPEMDYRRPPPQSHINEEPDQSLRERPHRRHHRHRHQPPAQPPPHMGGGGPPPRQRMPPPDMIHRMSPPPDRRFERRKERMPPPEKIDRFEKLEKPLRRPDERLEEPPGPLRPTRGDEWHDPWQRSKSPKRGRASRSRSRGRRHYRSSSGSSSSYSSSSSRSSRSRSSSYSSYSSRSSYSRSGSSSSSRSRSPSPRKNRRPGPGMMRRKHPHLGGRPLPIRDMPRNPPPKVTVKPGEPPKSTVAMKGKPGRAAGVPGNKMGPMPLSAPPGGPPVKPLKSPVRAPAGALAGKAPAKAPLKQLSGEMPASAPPGGPPPPGRGRKKEKNIRQRKHSSSSSGSSRSRSYSSSRSRSLSSVSSVSSTSSNVSSGSADSEHLYRDIADPVNSKKHSPKKKKVMKPGGAPMPGDPHMDARRRMPSGGMPSTRPSGGRMRPSAKGAALGPVGMPVKSAKDALKLQGQKSNIKLTLINKTGEKAPAKKRPAPPLQELSSVPPAKKPAKSVPPKVDKVAASRPEKPHKAMPVKKPDAAKPAQPPPSKKAPEPAKAPPAAKPAASPVKTKKSTSSRREELLKQLKAVEDAIARKRAKMPT